MKKLLCVFFGVLLFLSNNVLADNIKYKSDHQRFIGTWKLTGIVRPDGSPNLMLGRNPIAYIYYTKAGIMTSQLMRRHRIKFRSDNVDNAKIEETNRLLSDYLSYAGPFKVDTKRKVVIHHPKVHFFSNSVGKTLERSYIFKGNNHLYLTAVELHPKLIFIWKRISPKKSILKNPNYRRFVGTWKLINTHKVNGEPNLIYGKNPIGYLVYTDTGMVSANLMRENRIILHGDNIYKATPEEKSTLLHDYLGYTGYFTVDQKRHIVTHIPLIHVFPNNLHKHMERSYRFKGKNTLYLYTVGRKPALVFIWKRIK